MKIFKFEAAWCGPCQIQNSVLSNLGTRVGIPVERVDIESDDGMKTARVYGVRGVPTMIMFGTSGEEIKRHTGLLKEQEFLDWINEEDQ